VLLRAGLAAAATVAGTIVSMGAVGGQWVFALVAALGVLVIAGEITLFLSPRHRSLLPLCAAGCSLFALPVLTTFGRTAWKMWDGPIAEGSVRYGAEESLAFVHVLFVAACVVLAFTLWVRFLASDAPGVRVSAIASVASLACLTLAFVWTVPRRGDEGLLLWIFITPAFFLAACFLLGTCIIVLVAKGISRAKSDRPGQGNRHESPCSLPSEAGGRKETPAEGDAVAFDLCDCPRCNTRGVLPMPEGRCPNCKQSLGRVSDGN